MRPSSAWPPCPQGEDLGPAGRALPPPTPRVGGARGACPAGGSGVGIICDASALEVSGTRAASGPGATSGPAATSGQQRRPARGRRPARQRQPALPLVLPTPPSRPLGCRPRRSPRCVTARCGGSSTRRVGAGNPSGGAAVVGLVVHAVAEAIARGDVAPDEREIGPFVDEIWAAVPFPAHYQRLHERQPRRRDDHGAAGLGRLDRAHGGRHRADVQPARAWAVAARSSVIGSIDRVDRAADGPDPRRGLQDRPDGGLGRRDRGAPAAGHLPARDPPGRPRLRGGAALGRAVADRARARRDPDGASSGSASQAPPVALGQAELVHLADRFTSGMPKVRFQDPLDEGWTWVNDLIVDAARLADGPEYPARPNGHCESCAFRFMCPAQVPALPTARRVDVAARPGAGSTRGGHPRGVVPATSAHEPARSGAAPAVRSPRPTR